MMAGLRSLTYLLIQLVTVIPWAFVCLACAPLPLATRYRVTVQWPRAMTWAGRWICGLRWEVLGAENLPDGPVILLPKHQSTWETFYLIWAMPRDLCFVFKRELLRVPFFGWGMALLKMIHIDRAQTRTAFESVVRQGEAQLAGGRWVIIFPEGTRYPAGVTGKYKTGGARLAIRTGVPVVPIAVNAGRLWPKGKFIKKPGLITVSIGRPIDSAGKTPEQLTSEVETWIESEMRRISPADYGNLRASTDAA
jgi:1-acyl-sn-glycerol-3-phosphate acyltransferase